MKGADTGSIVEAQEGCHSMDHLQSRVPILIYI